jgi:hypothetical protein
VPGGSTQPNNPPEPAQNHPTSTIEYPASSIEYPASSIEYPASSIEYPASSIEYQASSIEYQESGIIAQNKPNFKIGNINISTARTKSYGNKQQTMNNERYPKQTQTNPIPPFRRDEIRHPTYEIRDTNPIPPRPKVAAKTNPASWQS